MNKSKDDEMFNCSEPYELTHVASQYKDYEKVLKFLKIQCKNKSINNYTHAEVYDLIYDELGLEKE